MMQGISRMSFRLKIALLAGLVTGGIVLSAGVLLWKLTYQFNLHGLDQNLRNLAVPNLQRQVGASHWKRLEESLSFVSGEENKPQYALWAETRGRLDFVSSNWPTNLDPSQWVKPWQMVSLETAPTAPERRQPLSDSNPALPLLSANYFTEFAGGKKWRVGIFNNYYTNLAIAVDIDNFDHGMDQLKRSYYFVLPLALLLAASGAWWIAQRSLGPVKALTRAVKDVSVERLENRLGGESYEIEFQGLIDKYNEMMERLEKSFLQSSRFSADASHELKTPLARLQVELEQALKKSKTNSETRKIFSSLLDEVVRLKTIIEKLLLLSASDSGKLTLNLRRVNLSELLANVVEDCETMAGAHLIKADLEREVFVNADRLLLEQALQNLASNALKYGEKGSLVQFALKQNKERIRMQVSNSGSSIGPEDKDRIFERFFRLDTVRNGNESGTGLGLSLSREIVRAHGGELYLDDSVKNQTVFVIELPA